MYFDGAMGTQTCVTPATVLTAISENRTQQLQVQGYGSCTSFPPLVNIYGASERLYVPRTIQSHSDIGCELSGWGAHLLSRVA